MSDGSALKKVIFRPISTAFLLSMNQAGLGNGRNGPRSTDYCGLSNMNVLCTTPLPERMSSIVCPGNAPHVVVTMP